ncbi:MAG: DUF456 domain-containing protein [Elusimicrobia bacterium]|jgi:uncharacterized protein YqgC (DUF456 family)|nr:DUF456 domain-containing protein [Elusimicrobiota bacterium]
MNIAAVIIIILIIFVSVIMVIAGLPGTFVAAGGILLFSMIGGFKVISLELLLWFFFAAVVGEIMEYISGILGAKKYGSSTKGIFGAIIGGMAGAIIVTPLLPGLGTVVGMFAGTFLGAFIGEYISGKDIIKSGRAGWGAFLGRVFAIGLKIIIVLALGAVSIVKYIYG